MAKVKTKAVEKPPELSLLIKQRDEVVERLENGEIKIAEAKAKGKNVTKWEDAWVELLHEYESLSDKIRKIENGLTT